MTPWLILLAFFVTVVVVWSPLIAFWLWRKNWRWPQPLITDLSEKLWGVASLYGVIPLVLGGYSYFLAYDWADLGLAAEPWGLGWGFILGVGTLLCSLTIQKNLGWITWQKITVKPQELGVLLGVGLLVGGVEEVLFRGFMTSVLSPYGVVQSAVLVNGIFAVMHLIWEPVSARPQLPGLFGLGIVLTWATTLTGGVYVAWGIHGAWVWGITFLELRQAVIYTQAVPPWITGLGGKPLAGLMGIMLLILTAVMLWGIYG